VSNVTVQENCSFNLAGNYSIPNGMELANIPWEDKPADCKDILWRSTRNPVIPRNLIPCSNSIFNSAVVPYQGHFAGVFRADDKRRQMRIHSGKSSDGYHWNIKNEPVVFRSEDAEIGKFVYGYDPRVVWIEDRYYITWCNGYHGPTIGVGYTYDFETFYQLENAFMPFNRNGVLFPRKINGRYAMLSRPSDNGHTPFGDIFYSESPDMCFWGRHRHVMSPTDGWQSTKIGAGPVPVETSEGWLLIYHGVLTSCNGYVYSAGVALLDLEQPWKVIHRSAPYLISPQANYECVGDVPNVVFPCAALVDAPTGRMAIYYGGADTVTCLGYAYVNELLDFVKSNSL
jgi:beta-1,4-mannooligosaccharide/beta-1,4-mannosyl-N-acetylglucosamine phosphorylase